MNKLISKLIFVCIAWAIASAVYADPAKDQAILADYFKNRFQGVPVEEYANGAYSFDTVGRESWEAIEEFPPYEMAIDDGQAMWEKPFANGKTYKSCFADGPAIAHKYPYWDKKKSMVITLALALNHCRKANGEKPLKYKKGSINNLLSYITFESRGNKTNVVVPKNDAGAVAAYEAGKKFYFTRRGQLNLSCASCHIQNAGNKIRSENLSMSMGHTTHFPVYRSKWGAVGTLHRRFTGCNKQVRAKPFKAQGEEYRNLEYYLTAMSNGLELNGPGARK
ncbi:MAG: sulfur oxidation c-type cytochrome SoxA [gamma proteobacterium symbiont of Taylorina sp.]|nr:sulfur oxidation c-type cytochrome SoxA [gamma proteobacterium symbiont of Taylorina sp.]